MIAISFVSCDTEQEVIDTGISDPVFNGSTMQYLRSNEFNWGITVDMIEKAELVEIFEGSKDTIHYNGEVIDGLEEFTFLAFTSNSCRHYLYPLHDQNLEELPDSKILTILDRDQCRELILKHIINERFLKEDVAFRLVELGPINAIGQTGYTEYNAIAGNNLWFYNEQNDYAGVPNAGAIHMYIYSNGKKVNVPIATSNIQTDNGVVHALDYNYILNNL